MNASNSEARKRAAERVATVYCLAALSVKGEHFACDRSPGDDHTVHGSRVAEAIWSDNQPPLARRYATGV